MTEPRREIFDDKECPDWSVRGGREDKGEVGSITDNLTIDQSGLIACE